MGAPYNPASTVLRVRPDLLAGLDEWQRAAVTNPAPLLAVIAGAGSGKTSVLTRRVAHRCATDRADPRHVAVLTFTRQAAVELRRRLRTLGIDEPVVAGTFHSVALSLLRRHWDDTGRRHPTVVGDRSRLIGEILGAKRGGRLSEISSEVDWARSRMLTPEQYRKVARDRTAHVDDTARALTDLEDLKRRKGVIDLDDLLSSVVEASRQNGDFAASMRWSLRHFFVDEAQDLNPLQLATLNAWRGERDDLTLVGDPSQAIYGFNGADSRVLLSPEEFFPGIEVVRLDTNYRCTPQIVATGLHVLGSASAPPPELRSARSDGPDTRFVAFDDEASEVAGVADLVRELKRNSRVWRDIAVLVRTNAQIAPIAASLEARGVPHRILGAAAADPVQAAVREAGEQPNPSGLATWSIEARRGDAEASDETVAARRRVADAVDEFLADGGRDGLSFMAWVRTTRPFQADDAGDAVQLLTFHAAKGREWWGVIVAGCEKGLLPHSSARTTEEVDEEVRLAYVAVTRAADRLVLTHARSRRGRKSTPSPFLADRPRSPVVAPPDESVLRDIEQRRRDRAPDPVLDELRTWRAAAARVSGLRPDFVCSDAVLDAIVSAAPTDLEGLVAVPGVERSLVDSVGSRIVAAVSRGLERRAVLESR
jgi:DNA helicase-2/ATP-dependent DNA helicase PcrA